MSDYIARTYSMQDIVYTDDRISKRLVLIVIVLIVVMPFKK